MRRLDWRDAALLVAFLPLWLGALALHLHQGLDNGLATFSFSVSSAESRDAYPYVVRVWQISPVRGKMAPLEVGDRILSARGRDLRGMRAARFWSVVHGDSDNPVAFEIERNAERQVVVFPPAPTLMGWWSATPLLVGLAAVATFLLLRAPHWHLRRDFYVACMAWSLTGTWFFTVGGWLNLANRWITAVGILLAVPFTLRNSWRTFAAAPPLRPWQEAAAAGAGLVMLGVHAYPVLFPRPLGAPLVDVQNLAFGIWALGVLAVQRRARRYATALELRQSRWVALGFQVGLVPFALVMIANALGVPFYALEEAFIVSRLGLVAIPLGFLVSIVGYGFLDIDRILSASTTYTLLAVLLVGGLLALMPTLAGWLAPALGEGPSQALVGLGLAGVAVPLYRVVQPRIEATLFAERQALHSGFDALLDALDGAIDREDLAQRLGAGIDGLLKPVSTVVYAGGGETFAPLFVRRPDAPPVLPADSPLVSTLASRATPLTASRWVRGVQAATDPFDRAALEALGAAVVVPVVGGGKLLAFVSLGPKRSGDIYTAEERALLAATAARASARMERFAAAMSGATPRFEVALAPAETPVAEESPTPAPSLFYRLGDYEVDPSRFTLRRGGKPVSIEPRPLQLLIHLLERAPEAVSKDALLDALWPETAVTEGSLTRAVREVRRALRERADESGTIRTVRGHGYAIERAVERVEGVPGVPAATPEPTASTAAEAPRRRLLALLSADAVGYSRHLAEDEAATVAALESARTAMASCIGDRDGRVVDAVGDNLLACFPSAVDAVRAAVAIQDALADGRLQFRLGIHLGEVLESGGNLYGDAVNIAARLEALAEAGGICLSGTTHDQVRGKLDLDYRDLGEQALKNIPERVRAFRVPSLHGVGGDQPATPGAPRLRRAALVVGTLLLLLGLALWASWPRPLGLLVDLAGVSGPPENPSLPDRVSLAILPFENLSGDPEQEYFSDGITQDLITEFARAPYLFVIAAGSAFAYKGKDVDVRQVGRQLGVEYVLEGSVRRADDRVRITVRLVDAREGTHVWSQRYDRELDDVFAIQSEITQEVLPKVFYGVQGYEARRLAGTPVEDFSARDALWRGIAEFRRGTREGVARARELYTIAAERDPTLPEPHAFIGMTLLMERTHGWSREPDLLDRAEQHARRAVALDNDHPSGHLTLAFVHSFRGELDAALLQAERARELARSDPGSHAARGLVLAQKGELLEASAAIRQALRLDPRHVPDSALLVITAYVNYAAGRAEQAIEMLERGRAANPDNTLVRLGLACFYGTQGRPGQADAAIREVLSVVPDLTAERALGLVDALRAVVSPAEFEACGTLLRDAGLP